MRTNKPKRYLVPCHGPDADAVAKAIQIARQELEKLPDEPREIVFVVPARQSFAGGTVADVIGDRFTKALLTGKPVQLLGLTMVRLETPKTLRRVTPTYGAIAFHADQEMLDGVDAMRQVSLVVVVPWTMEHVESWCRTWNPEVVGQSPKADDPIIQNPTLVAALTSLTRRVNLSTGIINPSDHDAAVDMFHILRRSRTKFDPKDVRDWCVRAGWQPKHADDLMKVAEKAQRRSSIPRNTGRHWADSIFEQWSGKA